ncbi:MAG TPA: hypothetical protein VH419_09825 [Nocardioidaceae bacterium]
MSSAGPPSSTTMSSSPEPMPPVASSPQGMFETFEDPPSSRLERLRFVSVCLVVGVLAAVPAAWLWVELADPPSTRLSSDGLVFGELAFNDVTSITLWFVVVGFAWGVVLGLVATSLGRRHGLVTVAAVLLMSVVGSTVMLWCGIHLFGPDHPVDFVALFNAEPQERRQMLDGFHSGDLLVSSLRLTTWVALLAWPIGAMAGALGGTYLWPKAPKPPQMPPS